MTGTPPVPAAVRARIERATAEAERLLTNAEQQPAEADGLVFRLHPALDRALVPTAVTVLSTIVSALSDAAHRYAWTADRLRATVDQCSEEAIAKLFAYCPRATDRLEDFRRDVLRAARKTPGWSAYLDVLKERSVAIIPFHLHLQAVPGWAARVALLSGALFGDG